MNRLAALSILCYCLAVAAMQAQNLEARFLPPGTVAPPLSANHLLGTSPQQGIDWPSLRGKAVVVEFWATWCVPCIAEIPILNALQASIDPARVQFISITDEDPALIERFLTKHPINGTVAIDTSSKTFEAYGIAARPATIVIGPDGRIVSTTAHPETLTAAQLLSIADGKFVQLASETTASARLDPKVFAQHEATLRKGLAAAPSGGADALFDISLTQGEAGDGHIMQRGEGQYDVTNVDLKTLLDFAAHIPTSRTTYPVPLPDTQYNLHVQAPNADPTQLARAVEFAILSAAHLHIERRTANTDALVLTALPGVQPRFDPAPASGMAFYNPGTKALMCMHATPAQIGSALREYLGKPIVDESGIKGTFSDSIPVDPTDLATTNKALAQAGLQLSADRRPIESYTITVVNP